MTTHLRVRLAQAGALLAVVLGGIVVAPAVALAQAPNVQITNLPTNVTSGTPIQMQYRVTNTNDGGGNQQQTVTARIDIEGMDCSGACDQRTQIAGGDGTLLTATLTPPAVDDGGSRDIEIRISASIVGEIGQIGTDTQTVTVRGAARQQAVRQVTGKVKDVEGRALSGVSVGLKDSNGGKFQATTNGSGAYAFTSTDTEPIAPGSLQVGASKSGYQVLSVTIQGQAGGTVNVQSLILKLVAATATAAPSVSASPTEEPTDEITTPAAEETTAGGVNADNAAGDGDGGISWLYIVVGILLVAAGAGAIVLVFLRRRNGDDADGDDDPTVLGGGPGGVAPPAYARFDDATRVTTPAGMAGATMVAPRSGAPSMSDAPTMLHRPVPVEDEFPDPYGVPRPQQGGYGAAGGAGWDARGYNEPNYVEPNQYGAAPADEGYGYATGGANYGGAPQQRYDEPTGLYQPEVDDAGYGGYDQGGYRGATDQPYGGATYGAGPAGGSAQPYGGGYAAEPEPAGQSGYGAWGAPAGGVDSDGGAYRPRSGAGYDAGGQQYGGQEPAGYDEQGRYEPGAYGGGYAPGGADDQAGYQQGGAYGEQTGRHGGQPRPEPLHPGQRRSGEWDG